MTEPYHLGKLTLVGDPLPAAWLGELVHEPWGQEAHVDSIVPPRFKSYARVLHPAYKMEPPYFVNGKRTPPEDIVIVEVPWAEIAEANHRVLHPSAQFESLVGYRDDLYRHKQPGLWDVEPRIGSLPIHLVDTLVSELAPYTSTPELCWFAIWEGYSGLVYRLPEGPTVHLPYRNYYLYTGPLDAALQPLDSPQGDHTANIWWPNDHAWCVATDIDLKSTYVGGSEACIARVLASPDLEAFPAKITDDVSIDSDQINPPPIRE